MGPIVIHKNSIRLSYGQRTGGARHGVGVKVRWKWSPLWREEPRTGRLTGRRARDGRGLVREEEP